MVFNNTNIFFLGLNDGLICLKSIIETVASSPSRTVRVSTISQSPSSNQLTKLDEDYDTMIWKSVLNRQFPTESVEVSHTLFWTKCFEILTNLIVYIFLVSDWFLYLVFYILSLVYKLSL